MLDKPHQRLPPKVAVAVPPRRRQLQRLRPRADRELTPRYDAEQLGILMESSPRHCDILVISGPVTRTCSEAVQRVYAQTPKPEGRRRHRLVPRAATSSRDRRRSSARSSAYPGRRLHPRMPAAPRRGLRGLAQAAAILGGDKPRPVRGRTTAEEAAAEEAAAEETVDAGDAAGTRVPRRRPTPTPPSRRCRTTLPRTPRPSRRPRGGGS